MKIKNYVLCLAFCCVEVKQKKYYIKIYADETELSIQLV